VACSDTAFGACESAWLTLRVNEQSPPALYKDNCSGAAITESLDTASTEGLYHNDGCKKKPIRK